MKSLTADEAVKLYPALKNLILLREADWKFLPVDERGTDDPVLDGTKIWPKGWRDCIRVHGEDYALGLRILLPADKHSQSEIFWEREGTLEAIVLDLLTLPAPGERNAPHLVIGAAPRLWTPNS